MTLHEKMKTTKPGRLAFFLRDLVYNSGHSLEKILYFNCSDPMGAVPVNLPKAIGEVAEYLESLAYDEVKKEALDKAENDWVREVALRVSRAEDSKP